MKTTNLIFRLFLFSFVLISCSDESKDEVFKTLSPTDIIISAEGNFGAKDGSISFVEGDFSTATKFLYRNNNNDAQLGGLIQSIAFNDENAYIILNDVNTIVIADRYTFVKKAVVTTGLGNPRYMTLVNGKGYITNWGDGNNVTDDYVAVLDLATNKIDASSKVSLDNGVEQIISKNNKLYVSHKGAFSSNNIISVVNLTDSSVSKITVNDNPDELLFSSRGELVVLCQGKPLAYGGAPNYEVIESTTSSISFIDIVTNTVKRNLEFPQNIRATELVHDNGKLLYYSDSKVHEIDDSSTVLSNDGYDLGIIYGMNFKDGFLYTLTKDFESESEVVIRDFSDKSILFNAEVGVGASKIYFNE